MTNHFAYNFARFSPILKILSPANSNIKLYCSNPSHLALLSSALSLITIHISDCRQFSDIHISQGSVATRGWDI